MPMPAECCKNGVLSARYVDFARFLRIVGDDNRLRILCLLKGGERCVCEIWRDLDIPQNLASSHLKVMLDAGLLKSRREQRKVYYSIDKNTLKKYETTFINFIKSYE